MYHRYLALFGKNMIDLNETTLTYQNPQYLDQAVSIPLEEILKAEARQDEVAFVTKMKAPELLTVYNKSIRDLKKYISQATAHLSKANKRVEDRKGVLTLEVIPARLAELKIASTKDSRDAVISQDKEYSVLTEIVDEVTAVIQYLESKAKSFENAYSSVKKIISTDNYNYTNPLHDSHIQNPNEDIKTEVRQQVSGFGKPKM